MLCVDLGESFHFSVSPHVPFLNLLFEQIANSNAYFLAKFGLDTAEKEPCRVCPIPRNAAASGVPPTVVVLDAPEGSKRGYLCSLAAAERVRKVKSADMFVLASKNSPKWELNSHTISR